MDFLKNLFSGFAVLSPGRRLSLLVASLATLGGIGLLVYWTGQAEYRVLFSNLSREDAGNIVGKLQEKKMPYQLAATGDTISVPADKVAELRLELAAAGLPQGGGVGFEIFDNKSSLGSTEFEQQVNYRRALQGELARTINSLEEIQQSRVHLALPKESLFLEQQKKATASITLKLKPGKSLRPAQVEGIAHLVSSSVEGINPEDVIIVDSRGNILSTPQADTRLAKMTNSQIEYQRSMERETAARIQSMLENVVGKGKAVVRVSADMDFRMTERTEENYDPDSPVIRSVKRQTEKTASPEAGEGTAAAAGTDREKLDETINYEINKVVNKTVMPVGEIRKLSVAVLIDGIYEKDGKGKEVYQPRAKKDIAALEELVAKTAGFNTGRGDQVVVTEMPFSRVDEVEGPWVKPSWRDALVSFTPLFRYGAGFMALMAVLLFFVRPMIRGILVRERTPVGEMVAQLPANVPAEVGIEAYRQAGAEGDKTPDNRYLAKQLAGADSKKFAEVLRNWLK